MPQTPRLQALVLLASVAVELAAAGGARGQSLQSFAVLGGETITNTGITTINGNIGLSPGSTTSGTGPAGANSIVLTGGTLHINDGVAQTAKTDLTTAFNVLMGRQTTVNLTGQTLGTGGVTTLGAGVYNFDTSAQLNGLLTLTGDASSVFVFKIGSTLTTAPASSIVLGGTVQASNVFFVVGSSATLDTTTAFKGQILALASITLNTAATINCGAAWARNGSVTLDNNTIDICTFAVAPGTFGDALGGGPPGNQQAVIDAINAFIAAGGTLPLAFEVLALLSPEELAAALSQLSGEIGTAAPPAGNQAMNSFLDQVLGQPGSTARTVVADENVPDNTVSVMGYASAPMAGHNAALDSVAGALGGPMPDIGRWTIWGAGYGGQTSVLGDASAGSSALTTRDYGFSIGFERHVSADTLFGFAISAGGTNFELGDSLGSGKSAMLQAVIYSSSSIDLGYVATALAYGVHAVATDRQVDIGGAAQYHAEFYGQDIAAGIEAGHDFGWFTPYVGARMQAYLAPAYGETTVSGSNLFALNYAGQTDLSARTEVGVKLHSASDFEGGQLRFGGSVAWAHTFLGNSTAQASFQALPGSSFTVTGASPAADQLLVSAGLDADLDSGVSLGGTLGAAFAMNAQRYQGSLHLGYAF